MIAGQRFEINLDDEDSQDGNAAGDAPRQGAFVGDVLERKPGVAVPPAPPTIKSTSGFPEHRKRDTSSRFKQRNLPAKSQAKPSDLGSNEAATNNRHTPSTPMSWEEEEKQRIDQENQQKLAQMSPDEIEEERRELMNSLGPTLLQRLLQRANIDSGSMEQDLSKHSQPPIPDSSKSTSSVSKTVSFAEPDTTPNVPSEPARQPSPDRDGKEEEAPATEPLPTDSIHFPRAPQPPDLDPQSSTFLTDLHAKYFPSLPSDPDKLEWMQASNPSASTYNPAATAFKPKDLRFSFRGDLIPPKTAAEIPVTAGLHHHGDAPDAAGYTIAELAHLAQSSYPAQRCIAFQTLGRILYRLGRGHFGELARGLWREMEQARVVDILVRESEGNGADRGRHVSAQSYATEAVWLWRKGGGRRWKAN
ncbi:RPAP1-like protein [Neohortaea acidophila]|uniref:RPAP1-like protein n=1 Tax=Neohortaea acidophila TaxID=245834 RepID=A0A6A6PPG1_9PEZI|nr:RPAP1-like protein [Neohortaea acidophila]KAF2481969.1 RPAP1-like protein [Neohortaea acidophila]